ncbi:MAG: alpha-amylase family glycosyl hydrolase [bacterium]
MGSIPYPGGTAFRVWAPFAESVFVTGTFNRWSETSHPLAAEGNGYWSVDVPEAKAGDEYKYVILNGTNKLKRIDPYAKDVTSSVGNAIIVDPAFDWVRDNYRNPAWEEMVIYEMHIGTFNDQPGGTPGNLSGAMSRLPYLNQLGINVIQVLPPAEFAGAFSWGYNPAHIFAIESDYGGPQALKEFVQAAHRHGIAVIFDVVYNHLGPSDLDLWQFDGWSENGKGGIYFYNDLRSHTPWGDTRPDYGRLEVRQYLRDNALMWLEEYRIDGLRWDATAYIRNVYGNNDDPAGDIPEGWELMRWINSEINARQPWKISIAEDLRNNEWITKDTQADGAGFDAQWDAAFVHPIRAAIISSDDDSRNMYAVRDAIYHRFNTNPFQRVIYTESHDEVANGKARVPHEISPDNPASYYSKKRSTLGAALVFASPGIPMIFQGQEFLEDEWFRDTDPIDWNKKEKHRGILNLYSDLIRLRRNWHNNTRGLCGPHVHVHHVNNTDKVIAFHRWKEGGAEDDVIVVANMANQAYDNYNLGFPEGGLWKVRFNSDWIGYDAEFGNHFSAHSLAHLGSRDGMLYNGNIGIGPYSVIILSQDK